MTVFARHRAAAAAGLGLLLLAAAPALADLLTRPVEPDPADAPAGPVPVSEAPLRAQCWQEGVKIIDEGGLGGLAITTATRADTVTFRRPGDANASVFLLPFADGLCLVKPER